MGAAKAGPASFTAGSLVRVDGGIAYRMKAVGNGNADIASPDLAGLLAAGDHQFALRHTFRDAHNHEGIRTDNDGRRDFTDGHPRRI